MGSQYSNFTATVTTDQGDKFTFQAPTDSNPGNPAFFGFIPSSLIFGMTYSDGALFDSATGHGTHEEMIGGLFVVLNQPPSLEIYHSMSLQVNTIAVNGAAGQTVVLESSTNLQTWLPLATNTLASDRWAYQDARPDSGKPKFYRVALH
jgi:hypothetical protein